MYLLSQDIPPAPGLHFIRGGVTFNAVACQSLSYFSPPLNPSGFISFSQRSHPAIPFLILSRRESKLHVIFSMISLHNQSHEANKHLSGSRSTSYSQSEVSRYPTIGLCNEQSTGLDLKPESASPRWDLYVQFDHLCVGVIAIWSSKHS